MKNREFVATTALVANIEEVAATIVAIIVAVEALVAHVEVPVAEEAVPVMVTLGKRPVLCRTRI